MRKLLIILFTLSGLVSISNQPMALACSGGSATMPIEYELEYSDYMVLGEFVEVDSLHANGIFHVDSYLFGEANAEYLAIYQSSASQIHALDENYYNCESYKEIHAGDRAILALYKTGTGAFAMSYYSYVFPNGTARQLAYYTDENGETITNEQASIADIASMIKVLTQQEPVLPNFDLPKALVSPLLITTDKGSVYLIPFDIGTPLLLGENVLAISASGELIAIFTSKEWNIWELHTQEFQANPIPTWIGRFPLCSTSECFQIAGNGLFFIAQGENTAVCVNGEGRPCFEYAGIDFSVSPNGEHMLMWDKEQLSIYPLPPQEDVKESSTTNFDISNIVWSPDGTQLAYTDTEGLWIWSGFTWGGLPHLIVPRDKANPHAINFSPTGRYLLIKDGEQQYNLDLLTNLQLPQGIFSPDEQYLLEFGEDYYQLCDVSSSECRGQMPLELTDIFWLDSRRFMASGYFNDRYYLFIQKVRKYSQESSYSVQPDENLSDLEWYIGTRAIYDSVGGNVVILNNPSKITILYNPNEPSYIADPGNHITLDLSAQLDGDIVDIRWLEGTLFYQQ